MNARLLIPSSIALALTALVAAQACSGSSDNPPAGDTGGQTTGDSGSHTNGNGGGDGGSSSPGSDGSAGGGDTGATGDASSGVDAADLADGGVPVTPGVVQCGAVDCHVDQSTCCVKTDGGTECVSGASTSCPVGQASIHCLEAADCSGGKLCCGSFNLQAQSADTQCATSCPIVQFCRTNGECKNGQPCVVQSCGGETLELCGLQSTFGCTAK